MYTIHKTRQSSGIYFALIPFMFLAITAVAGAFFGLRAAVTPRVRSPQVKQNSPRIRL
jgi:hypothetical protein